MEAFSNLGRSRIAEFVANERQASRDWFLSDAAENFAAPADIVLYFSAFCVGLAHANKALKDLESILKRVKSIMASWGSKTEARTSRTATADGSKNLRLKEEEKVIITIYRSICAGKGGIRGEEIAASLKIPEPNVDRILADLRKRGVVSYGERSKRWSFVT
jgi:uncharacterized membrane protein